MFTAHIASYQKEERNQKAMLERKCEHSLFSVFFNRIGNMGEGTWHMIEPAQNWVICYMGHFEPLILCEDTLRQAVFFMPCSINSIGRVTGF